MSDAELQAFEAHYFACVECAAYVQLLIEGELELASRRRNGFFRSARPLVVFGSLAHAVSLVNYANASGTESGAIDALDTSRLTAFRTTNSLTFTLWHRVGPIKWPSHVHRSAEGWFAWLRDAGALPLHAALDSRTHEIVLRSRVEGVMTCWRSMQEYIGDQFNGRVWDVAYSGWAERPGTSYADVLDVESASESFRLALDDALAQAITAGLDRYALKFLAARTLLDDVEVPSLRYFRDLLPDGARPAAIRLAGACMRAWVSERQSSDEIVTLKQLWSRRTLVARLQKVVLDGIIAIANSSAAIRDAE